MGEESGAVTVKRKRGRRSLGNVEVELHIPFSLYQSLSGRAELRGISHQRLITEILCLEDSGVLTTTASVAQPTITVLPEPFADFAEPTGDSAADLANEFM